MNLEKLLRGGSIESLSPYGFRVRFTEFANLPSKQPDVVAFQQKDRLRKLRANSHSDDARPSVRELTRILVPVRGSVRFLAASKHFDPQPASCFMLAPERADDR